MKMMVNFCITDLDRLGMSKSGKWSGVVLQEGGAMPVGNIGDGSAALIVYR